MIRNQVLSEFGVVRVSSVWFDYTEPYRTTVIKGEEGYREVSSAFGVVRPHRTSSNLCDASGSMATAWTGNTPERLSLRGVPGGWSTRRGLRPSSRPRKARGLSPKPHALTPT